MANQKRNTKSVLNFSINSRLLFNSKAEAEQFLGIANLDNVKSEPKIRNYTNMMDEWCEKLFMLSLEELVSLYSKAIEMYKADSLSFGHIEKREKGINAYESEQNRRRRREYREKIAVKLFIWTYLNNTAAGRYSAQRPIDSVSYSKKSFEAYFSTETGEELIDVCFTVLLHWGIVKPHESNTYDYDIKSDNRREKMLNLLNVLKQEIPKVGIFAAGGLPALDMAIKEITNSIASEYYPTTAEYWLILRQIGCSAFLSAYEDTMEAAGLETYIPRWAGIWIDSEDNGNSRFWVFPDNYQYAFCFRKNEKKGVIEEDDEKWGIELYEFFVCSPKDGVDRDYIVWSNVESSRNVILNGGSGCDGGSVSYMYFDTKKDDHDEICVVNLYSMKKGLPCPLPFRQFNRLSIKDKKFKTAKYHISQPHFHCEPNLDMVNLTNALLAVDKDYIYLYDYDMSKIPFAMQIEEEYGEFIRYHYSAVNDFCRYNLCNVGKNDRVIRLSRNIEGSKWKECLASDPDRYQRLCYALNNVDINGMVTIYHFGTDNKRKIIFFNDFSIGFSFAEYRSTFIRNDEKITHSLLKLINPK